MINASIEQLDHYDLVHQPNRYIRTGIETSDGRRYCDIPVDDVISMGEIYERTPHENLNLTPEGFVLKLSSRLFSEWCMEDELKARFDPNYKSKDHNRHYTGQGFSDFAMDETHHELVRGGFIWDKEKGQFEGMTEGQYRQTRDSVLCALVCRAIELFSDWGGNSYPPSRKEEKEDRTVYIYDDQRNLRNSLESYTSFAA